MVVTTGMKIIGIITTPYNISIHHHYFLGWLIFFREIPADYKHRRPLPVLPINRSRLPQGLPLNVVPGGGVPSLQVEGCQASNIGKAHHLSQMHKTRY